MRKFIEKATPVFNRLTEWGKRFGGFLFWLGQFITLKERFFGAFLLLLAVGILVLGKWGEGFLCVILGGVGLKKLIMG